MKLSELKVGEYAYIEEVNGSEDLIHRLSEIGFIRGERIYSRMRAPLQDPIEYEIMNTNISLRRSEASEIIICKEKKENDPLLNPTNMTINIDGYDAINIPKADDAKSENSHQDITHSSASSGSTVENEKNDLITEQPSCHCNMDNGICQCQVEGKQCQCNKNESDKSNKKKSKRFGKKRNLNVKSCCNHDNTITPNTNKRRTTLDGDDNDNNEDDEVVMDIEDTFKYPAICKCCPSRISCLKLRPSKWNGLKVHVAILGNPNSGKTTMFNRITGGHEMEGNYCGVTVDAKEGRFLHNGYRIYLIDLPGLYSLTSYSPEEKYVEKYLKENTPDVILNVLDSNNLPRNLYLTTQIMKLGIPIIGLLNMYDEVKKNGISIDVETLSERLNTKFIPTVSRAGKGLTEVFDTVVDIYSKPTQKYPEDVMKIDSGDACANYKFINKTLENVFIKNKRNKDTISTKIDRVVTNRFLSFPILIILVYLIFYVTYMIGDYPMTWIDELVAWIGDSLGEHMSDSAWKDLLIDGIIAGVGGVIIFLPNILLLYLFLSIMEDSGYMARAVFILDRLMRSLGLHGKSFIPMITGFGCNVPAIMATRTIEDRKSRLITILVIPLMSCSARLPVYVLLAGAFFSKNSGLVVASLYIIGVILAIILAKILSLFVAKQFESKFIMELPPYRFPTVRNVLKHTWEKGKQYLKKMGTIILIASIIIWVLGYFPNHEKYADDVEKQMENSFIGYIGKFVEPVFKPMGSNWKMDIGLLSGLGAKEVVVSTLGVLYSGTEVDTEDDEQTSMLSEKIANDITPLAGFAYMLFVLIYFPCVATIAAVKHETGTWKWAGFTVVYTVVLAWIISTLVYQIGSLF